jgi:hypothetical protein
MSKQKQTRTPDDQPVRSSVSDEYLTWADGSFITHEHYSEYSQEAADEVAKQSDEETYVVSIRAGLPRDPEIESRLDMEQVQRLLAVDG